MVENNDITVISGPSRGTATGPQTVGQLRAAFGQLFNIPADAVALSAGSEVSDETVIQGGSRVSFQAASGEKG